MKQTRFSQGQMVAVLREREARTTVVHLVRGHRVTKQTSSRRKKHCGADVIYTVQRGHQEEWRTV